MNFKAVSIAAAVCVFIGTTFAAAAAPLRRPISPQTPMFLFQVQQSDPADPQADINAVPADLRPYIVMTPTHLISWQTTHDQSRRVSLRIPGRPFSNKCRAVLSNTNRTLNTSQPKEF